MSWKGIVQCIALCLLVMIVIVGVIVIIATIWSDNYSVLYCTRLG